MQHLMMQVKLLKLEPCHVELLNRFHHVFDSNNPRLFDRPASSANPMQ